MRHFTKPFENGYGFCMYREYWRVWVPLLLAPRHGTTSVDQLTDREEDRVREVLLQVKISSYLQYTLPCTHFLRFCSLWSSSSAALRMRRLCGGTCPSATHRPRCAATCSDTGRRATTASNVRDHTESHA